MKTPRRRYLDGPTNKTLALVLALMALMAFTIAREAEIIAFVWGWV